MAHWDRNHETVLLIADGVVEGEKQDLGGWDDNNLAAFTAAIREHLNYIYDGNFKSARIKIKDKNGELVYDKTIRS